MESTLKTPPPRAQSMLCRISDNKFILIAGANRTEHFGDAWLLQPDPKGNKWVHLNTSTLPRSGHSGGGDSDRLYFFGGQNVHADQLYNDVGMFDCKSLTMKQDNYDSANVGKQVPIPRNSHTFCYDSTAKRFILFGGAGSIGELNDLFIYNIETKIWENKVAKSNEEWPSSREMHIAHVYIFNGDPHMILIGGRINGGMSCEIWDYDINKNEWRRKKAAPIGIAAAGSTLINNRYVILYGGTDGVKFLNNFYLYDIIEDVWKESDPTKFIKDVSGKISSCLGVADKYLLIYGGCGIEQEFGNVELIPIESLSKVFGVSFE